MATSDQPLSFVIRAETGAFGITRSPSVGDLVTYKVFGVTDDRQQPIDVTLLLPPDAIPQIQQRLAQLAAGRRSGAGHPQPNRGDQVFPDDEEVQLAVQAQPLAGGFSLTTEEGATTLPMVYLRVDATSTGMERAMNRAKEAGRLLAEERYKFAMDTDQARALGAELIEAAKRADRGSA